MQNEESHNVQYETQEKAQRCFNIKKRRFSAIWQCPDLGARRSRRFNVALQMSLEAG
jgi:hypothetical protein